MAFEQKQLSKSSFEIPDLCQTSSLLFLVLVSELLVLAWNLSDQSFQWSTFGISSLAMQWVVLLSAGGLCRLRPYLARWSLKKGWLLCFVLVQVIVVVVLLVVKFAFEPWAISRWGMFQQFLATSIVTAMVLRFFQLQQQVIDHSQAEVNSKMDALQARIKPHFLFNSLNTIAELVASRPEAAEKAVENLSSLFRANLKEKSSFCALQQEVSLVKGYLELEQWRLGGRLQVEWQESVHDRYWPVPILCLQPLVENAVVHGVASEPEGGLIKISVLQTPRITTLTVENTIGPAKDTHAGHGVGVDNVKRRLNVLYGEQARCRVERTDKYYKVTVTLPKNDEG